VARGIAAFLLVSFCSAAAAPAFARSSEGDRRIPRPRQRVWVEAPVPTPLVVRHVGGAG
jgi:hypothetical protein